MPTEVKICGLSDEESVDAALDAGADLLGFVFFPPSPRNVDLDRAASLMRRARGKAAITALLVDPDQNLLDDVVRSLSPDLLQLHGRESPERVAAIRADAMLPVIKAVGIGAAADLQEAGLYAGVADRLILDARPPRDATRPGGHGAPFDWALLDGFAPGCPWLLSGGLGPKNVVEAIRATSAPGVDVSSGVERAPGRKDPDLIRAFVAAVRTAESLPRRLAG
jgi:phosphoribosylanthranilate isomerase